MFAHKCNSLAAGTLAPCRQPGYELPRRGDVMVSEIMGSDPWGERLLEVTADAKKRRLEPKARFLPGESVFLGFLLRHGMWRLENAR